MYHLPGYFLDQMFTFRYCFKKSIFGYFSLLRLLWYFLYIIAGGSIVYSGDWACLRYRYECGLLCYRLWASVVLCP
jgi:hypothetical protein